MGLDMSFFRSEQRLKLNQINSEPIDWDSLPLEEVYYFRRYWALHNEIFRLYNEKYPGEVEKYEDGDNCLIIELDSDILSNLEGWVYNTIINHKDDRLESDDYDCRLHDFYPILCSMICRTKHGELFYYEGDY